MAAAEYIFPGLTLLGAAYFFLEIGLNMQEKELLRNENSVFSFVDVGRLFMYGLALFFLFMAVVFGRAVVDNSTTNMAEVFNTTQTTFALSVFVLFVGLLAYVIWAVPWILKRQLKAAKKMKEEEDYPE